jgi:hypothetical protein
MRRPDDIDLQLTVSKLVVSEGGRVEYIERHEGAFLVANVDVTRWCAVTVSRNSNRW